MDFLAIIKKVIARHSVTNDKTIELILQTDNPLVLDLGKIKAETRWKIHIEIDEESSAKQREEE